MKHKQIRKTHFDTKNIQKKLRELIKNKIDNNLPLTNEEKDEWDVLIADAFLSVGTDKKVFVNRPATRIAFGSAHTFALRFWDWGNPVVYKYNGGTYTFQIKELWELLYDCCLELFPYALADAVHMSKESEEREPWKPASFSSSKKLENE